jgi:phage/plasmid-like protein (TIGR03299 family)
MYYGEQPWHKLGKNVDHVQTSTEAIVSAGLDWKVNQSVVEYMANGISTKDKKHMVNYRSDNNQALGIVGDGYQVLQNKDSFRFFDAIVGIKEAIYHTAGALGNGERIWLLAKLPGYIRTMGDDVTEKFLLLSNSHDGSSAVQVMFTPIRVVCQNTLNVALGAKTNKVSVRHTLNMGLRVTEIQKELGIVNQRFQMFEEASQKLAVTQVTSEVLKKFVFDSGLVPKESESTRAENIMDEVSRLFEYGKGADLKGAKGTAWGAFNAVVEYVDHKRGGDNLAKRSNSLLYGSGSIIKQKAFNNALALVK